MKVLATGAGGQLGAALIRTCPEDVQLIPATRGELDVCDYNALRKFVSEVLPDAVVNAAAYTAVDQAEEHRNAAEAVNASALEQLARLCREHGARLIHISTDYVFDGLSATPYSVESSAGPLSVYGASKRRGEQFVLDSGAENPVVVRSSWLYGRTGRNFVTTMLSLMRSGDKPLRIVTDQVGAPTWAVSLAGAVWRIVDRPDLTGIRHWSDSGVASWYDFAVAIYEEGRALGLVEADVCVEPIYTDDYPAPARRPPFSVLDTRRLQEELGITPEHWRVNLRKMLEELSSA